MGEELQLSIRALRREDAVHLHAWLNDERVLAFYEGRDRTHDEEMILANFFPEDDEDVSRFLVLVGSDPIGYVQYYPIDDEEKEDYGYAAGEIIYGMDQFIGEPSYWNRGFGSRLVTTVVQSLAFEKQADRVIMDPQAWNARAIRCYEKCGFEKVKLLPRHEWHEGEKRDCWLMEWRAKR
ncbi:GNAT family N-acetyltransferase [Brevibacillus borstelensis]